MPVFPDQYPAQLPEQARTALFGWYTKEFEKDAKLTEEERAGKIADKVLRVMKVQFPADGERIAALPDRVLLLRKKEIQRRTSHWKRVRK